MLDDVEVLVDVWYFPETLKLSGQPGKRESLNLIKGVGIINQEYT